MLGRAETVTALTIPLSKPEVRHPYYRVPYKSLPQDNVNNLNHDGQAPTHLACSSGGSDVCQLTMASLHLYAKANMNTRVRHGVNWIIFLFYYEEISILA